MTSKRFHEFPMNPHPTGYELDSVLVYFMRHNPNIISFLHYLYGEDLNATVMFMGGFALALSMVEDNGCPVDIDEVMHGYDEGEEGRREGEHFDILKAIMDYRKG